MEQRDDKWRGPKSAGADGGDLIQAQAQMWMDLGTALAGMLRRVRRRAEPAPVAEERSEDEAGRGLEGDREAA